MSLKVITPPATEPLSLEEAKRSLKIDLDDDDTDVLSLIVHARDYCEDYQKKKYITQTLDLIMDDFPNEIQFKDCSPVQSVNSIKYIDSSGTENIVPSADYILDNVSLVNRLVPAYNKQWPTVALQPINAVRIQFTAGYGTADKVPDTVKWAMKIHMRLLYDDYRPEEREKLEQTRDRLLGMKRVISV